MVNGKWLTEENRGRPSQLLRRDKGVGALAAELGLGVPRGSAPRRCGCRADTRPVPTFKFICRWF